MSSDIRVTFDEGEGISIGDWLAFCAEHGIAYMPEVTGRNVFGAGEVEIGFGKAVSAGEPREQARPPASAAKGITGTWIPTMGRRTRHSPGKETDQRPAPSAGAGSRACGIMSRGRPASR
jgi:hypothetical protein